MVVTDKGQWKINVERNVLHSSNKNKVQLEVPFWLNCPVLDWSPIYLTDLYSCDIQAYGISWAGIIDSILKMKKLRTENVMWHVIKYITTKWQIWGLNEGHLTPNPVFFIPSCWCWTLSNLYSCQHYSEENTVFQEAALVSTEMDQSRLIFKKHKPSVNYLCFSNKWLWEEIWEGSCCLLLLTFL